MLLGRIAAPGRRAVRELPLESVAVAAAAGAVLAIAHRDRMIETALRVFLAALLAAPLFLSLSVLRRAGRLRAPAHAAAALACAALAAALAARVQAGANAPFPWSYAAT